MNLLFRYLLLTLWLKEHRDTKPKVTDAITRQYRILPHDMGFRDHVPNYRYLSFIELNIEQWFVQQNPTPNAKWIISSQQMTYLQQGRLFDKVTARSQLLGWDAKYFYFRHEFLVKGQVIAVALTKFVVMLGSQVLATNTIADKPEQSHPVITSWQANLAEIKNLEPIG